MNNTTELVYWTPEEAAVVLRVTTRTVYEWLRVGRLESYRPYGRWLITPEQVENFVTGGRSSQIGDTSPPGAAQVAAPTSPMANRKSKRRQ